MACLERAESADSGCLASLPRSAEPQPAFIRLNENP
jgi:hypothetical protein